MVNQQSMQYRSALANNSCTFADYLGLGASLYIPASRKDLTQCVNSPPISSLRSVIFCLEDAIAHHQVPQAISHIEQMLATELPMLNKFIRPRSPRVLAQILKMDGIEQLQGVVLPKINEESLKEYGDILAMKPHLKVMPTLETSLAFSRNELRHLREIIGQFSNPILCIRIGANDLFALLGLKRARQRTVYEGPLRAVIDDIILSFKPFGYHVAAPVYDYLDDQYTLTREVVTDTEYGLWTKTAIHPKQVDMIESQYQVCIDDYIMAEAIISETAPAVFQLNGQMCEPCVHHPWAEQTLFRAQAFGVQSVEK